MRVILMVVCLTVLGLLTQVSDSVDGSCWLEVQTQLVDPCQIDNPSVQLNINFTVLPMEFSGQ